MWWMALAQVGMSLLGSMGQSKIERAQYKANKILDKAEYEAKERNRLANNELVAAQASLTDFMRSESNKRLIESAGDAYNALGQNIGRGLDQAVTGNVQRRIQAAEQLGAISASAAAAGVGGSTVDLINGSLRLRNAMLNEEIEKQEGQASYDQLMQRAGVMDQGYSQYDYAMEAGNLDYQRAQMPIRIDPGGGSSWKSVFLETSFGALGNLFNKSGDRSGPLSLLTKLGMNNQSSSTTLERVGGLFGNGGQSGPQYTGQGLQPSRARSSTTTSAGYTFQGL